MSQFIFRCPTRGLMVQGWATDESSDRDLYVAQRCPACGGMHLVNPRTGKLRSEEQDARKSGGEGDC